jgi:hypothetical protein
MAKWNDFQTQTQSFTEKMRNHQSFFADNISMVRPGALGIVKGILSQYERDGYITPRQIETLDSIRNAISQRIARSRSRKVGNSLTTRRLNKV